MPDPGETLSQVEGLSVGASERAEVLFLEIECERPLAGPACYPLAGVRCVRLGRARGREGRLTEDGTLVLGVPDRWMSVNHAELRRAAEGWSVYDLASKNGTVVCGTRISEAPLPEDGRLQAGQTFFRLRRQQATGTPAAPGGYRTVSPRFAEVLARAAAVAPARLSVLLYGESGTGKEVLARAIHAQSGRAGAFVAVNCGAVPQNLVESELFGYRRGAFSGADCDRLGLVQASDGGTLFLDEVGDLSASAQSALLRVLQEREVHPVGALRPEPVKLRVISATHRNLDALVRQDKFRHDLLARLNGLTIDLPPLRERTEDIPILIADLLQALAPERGDVRLSPAAAAALLRHDWPQNVRELEQALEAGLALSGAGVVDVSHLPRVVVERDAPAETDLTDDELRRRDELVELLRRHRGNVTAVARVMGKGRTQIGRWISRFGLRPGAYRSR